MFHAQQFLLFCLVGVTTTLVDFLLFNLLTRPSVGWPRIPANLVSVTAAMAWSFLANWIFVFAPEGNEWLARAGRFLVTTLFSAFVLQNLVLHLTSHVWKWPSTITRRLVQVWGWSHRFNDDFCDRNTCKILAVSTGLIWNFFWYKFFVYAN